MLGGCLAGARVHQEEDSMTAPRTANLGYPRIGRHRELKFALEDFWKGRRSEAELLETATAVRRRSFEVQRAAGIDIIPSNDFSLYDQVLDALVLVGATPARFGSGKVTLQRYFGMARNSSEQTAMEMTKWFDTNYHYLVPEWSADLPFAPDTTKLLAEVKAARELGIESRPVVIGPVTLLLLGKSVDGTEPLSLLPKLLKAYASIFAELKKENVKSVQIDEPILVTDLPAGAAEAFETAYAELAKSGLELMLTTYFGELGDNAALALGLGTAGVHIDVVRAPEQLKDIAGKLGAQQTLSIGCIDGRNIWSADLPSVYARIEPVIQQLGAERVQIAPSCSLLHVPHTTADEKLLDRRVASWLSFADEKLAEVHTLALGPKEASQAFAESGKRYKDRLATESSRNAALRERLAALQDEDFKRHSAYPQRAKVQRDELKLPLLPTTTIGSFPQTADVRKQRAAHKNGHITTEVYETFLREEIERCVREQERIGLDVLVHGEFERNDMVEHFGEFFEGVAFTENGWVQSYGSRCVKPPVIFGDVLRPEPITVRWSQYASSLSDRPMKGMLTGPITILQWSFVRDDIPESETAWQLALALRDEVCDLEAAGIRVVQVDEPALREGLPLRRAKWNGYLDWAVKAFKLATSGVEDGTQIHTHMCYCNFEDVLPAIAAMDADVISMESARSRGEMIDAFRRHGYPNEIGPGVYDIHSPRVPPTEEMQGMLRSVLEVLRPDQVWVNPDCGLKTRGWTEVSAALKNMCEAAATVRKELEVRA
jgi:5-methyltetrahydropteroyltriglutamate--homocysteine methyltransferase